jgi:hypothetical protein
MTTTYEISITAEAEGFIATVWRRRTTGSTQKTDSVNGGWGETEAAARAKAEKVIAHFISRAA